MLEDLVSTVDIRLLEASILLLAEVTVFATAAVAVAVYTAFIPAFIMEKTSKYKYYFSVMRCIKESRTCFNRSLNTGVLTPATPTNTDGSVKACRAFVRNKLASDDRSIC